ncbi:MAG: flagellar basal body P-ring protein FlgI [Halanaerobiales bacterium]
MDLFNRKITPLIITIFLVFGLFWFSFDTMAASANDPVVRIGDISRIEGVRNNQLTGYGLVIGLAGSGDSPRNESTIRSISNMLDRYGVDVTSDEIQSQNVAAVMVTAELPPYSSNGDQIDVTVSSIGDAESLQGGNLLQTPLKAANEDIYAVAQGSVSIGGYNVQQGGAQERQNHPTTGSIPEGAIVEKEVDVDFDRENVELILDQPDFNTASNVAEAINDELSSMSGIPSDADHAQADSPGRVKIDVPDEYRGDEVDFIARINELEVRSNMRSKVVINERTGTVVMGHNVRISTVSVAHADLTVSIRTEEEASEPPPFGDEEDEEGDETEGEEDNETTETTNVDVEEEEGQVILVENENTIQDLTEAINAVGASPRDLIAILQQIKAAGALHAELEIQ